MRPDEQQIHGWDVPRVEKKKKKQIPRQVAFIERVGIHRDFPPRSTSHQLPLRCNELTLKPQRTTATVLPEPRLYIA